MDAKLELKNTTKLKTNTAEHQIQQEGQNYNFKNTFWPIWPCYVRKQTFDLWRRLSCD